MPQKLPQYLHEATTLENLKKFLQELNIKYEKPNLLVPVLVFSYDETLYVYDNSIIKPATHWIYDIELHQYLSWDYDKDFWASIRESTVVYHGTNEENLNSIWAKGKLETRSKTRGFSNKHIGPAIFCSLEIDSARQYGTVIEVLVGKMQRDGWMPYISTEPEIEYYEMRESIAHAIGLDDFVQDLEDGVYHDTIIFYDDIPTEYLRNN